MSRYALIGLDYNPLPGRYETKEEAEKALAEMKDNKGIWVGEVKESASQPIEYPVQTMPQQAQAPVNDDNEVEI